MEHRADHLVRSSVKRGAALVVALALLACAVVAETVDAIGDPESLVAIAGGQLRSRRWRRW